jgi:hypothetical protein
VIGALKWGLTPASGDLGIHVCGGRGKYSRQTPHELVAIGDRVGIDGTGLATASCLVAKVHSAVVQDGFDLYLHGCGAVVDQPHAAIDQGVIVNLTDRRADACVRRQLDLLAKLGPDGISGSSPSWTETVSAVGAHRGARVFSLHDRRFLLMSGAPAGSVPDVLALVTPRSRTFSEKLATTKIGRARVSR